MIRLSMNEYGIVRRYAIGRGKELTQLKQACDIRHAFVLPENKVCALELNSKGEAISIACESHIDMAFRKAVIYQEYMIEPL